MSEDLFVIPDNDFSEIQERLTTLETEHGARILFAIESGSRAWGFPSPDSDYDVRFVFVRKPQAYIALTEPRDVIESPIEGLFDINGWDLRKALNLMLKANPILIEWLRSPIVYRANAGFIDDLENILTNIDERPAAQHHYYGLLKSQWRKHIESSENAEIKLKKYFYGLRPAFALKFMWENPSSPLPMRFDKLMRGVDTPTSLSNLIADLLAKKRVTKELGFGPRIPTIDLFLEETLREAEARQLGKQIRNTDEVIDACEKFFQSQVGLT